MWVKIRKNVLLLVLIIVILALLVIYWLFTVHITRYKYSVGSLSPSIPSKDSKGLESEKINEQSRSEHVQEIKRSLNTKSVVDLFADNSNVENDNGDTVTIISTGDYIPARSVNFQSIANNDYTWAVKKVAYLLKSADITLVNLETPLIESCPVTTEGMTFCGLSENIQGLVSAGVDVVSLSNNHVADYGNFGIDETLSTLRSKEIKFFGINTFPATLIDVRGIKYGFVGFNDIGNYDSINSADIESVETQIHAASIEADVVIVTFHWGEEYTDRVTERQKILAHTAIDSGATVVLGNHPHWIQPAEFYKDRLILYAHGNFVFDQMWSEKTKEGVISVLKFEGKNLIKVNFIPVYIENYGQVIFPDSKRSKSILENFKNISIVHENNLRRN